MEGFGLDITFGENAAIELTSLIVYNAGKAKLFLLNLEFGWGI